MKAITIKEAFLIAMSEKIGHKLVAAMEQSTPPGISTKEVIAVPNALSGLSSGFCGVDFITDGWPPSEFIILAGRPSIGKTSLAYNFLESACFPRRGKPVRGLLFSLEMAVTQAAHRLLASRARLNVDSIEKWPLNNDDEHRLLSAADELCGGSVAILNRSDININELREVARKEHAENRLGLIIVDYIQLIRPTEETQLQPRDKQIAEISRGLKAMAMELEIPVIACCQMNKSMERENRAPALSDLRDSGALEEDADLVAILSYPAKKTDDCHKNLWIAKQRNGPGGNVNLTHLREIYRFENYTRIARGRSVD